MKELTFRLKLKGKIVGTEIHRIRKGDIFVGIQIFHNSRNVCEGNPLAYEPAAQWITHDEKELRIDKDPVTGEETYISVLPDNVNMLCERVIESGNVDTSKLAFDDED